MRKPDIAVDFSQFLSLAKIKHFHFGSFKQLPMPFSTSLCYEGVHPDDGDIDPELLLNALRHVNNEFPSETGMVLEVRENDYDHREVLWETAYWIQRGLVVGEQDLFG
ncbi:MAG: hypothetical protein OWR62_16120 [Sulfobacillus thermotolerans]|nr:hypothetical protein [Sulfobacillus thermotolerans]